MNVNKIWVKFEILERQRHIQVNQLTLATKKSRVLLKARILTGCDVTSKFGSKSAAFKACPEKYLYFQKGILKYLYIDFGEECHDYHFWLGEKYLVKVT